MNSKVYSQNKKNMTPVQQLFSNVEKLIPNYTKYCKPGYTKEQLTQFEKELGYSLPDAVKEFYLKTKGNDIIGLAYGWTFYPIIEGYHSTNDYQPNSSYIDNPNRIKKNWNTKKRIPIIGGGGSVIYLDFDPDSLGTHGQLILVFRDYPEIIFSVTNDFESFVCMLNEKFNRQEVKGYIEDEESKYVHIVVEMKDGGGNDYSNWVSMSHNLSSENKNRSDEPLNIDSTWKRSLKESRNDEFIVGRGANGLKKSDTDRFYYILLRDEALRNVEPLTLFPNIAKVEFYLKDSAMIPNRLWEILEKTRIVNISFSLNKHSLKLVDSEGILKLKTLSKLSLIFDSEIENIHLLTQLSELKELELNQGCDLSFLKGISKLVYLELNKDSVNYQNWDAIASLQELRYLQIPNSNFSDLNILTNLKNLKNLHIGSDNLQDYTVFEKLPSKLWIGCSYNLFEKIFDIAIKKQFTFSSFYGKSTSKQEELYQKYRQIRETWK